MSKERLIGFVDDLGIYCDFNDKESIESTLHFLESETGEEWSIFKENYGNKNTVVFRKAMFCVKKDHLQFKGGNLVELPLNCSSIRGMFASVKFGDGFKFGDFDAAGIVDMKNAFKGAVLSYDFYLPENFEVKEEKSKGMFEECIMPNGLSVDTNDSFAIVDLLKQRHGKDL